MALMERVRARLHSAVVHSGLPAPVKDQVDLWVDLVWLFVFGRSANGTYFRCASGDYVNASRVWMMYEWGGIKDIFLASPGGFSYSASTGRKRSSYGA